MTAPVLVSNEIINALKAGSAQGVDVDKALDQLATLVEVAGKNTRQNLVSIKTAIAAKPNGEEVVVGWDTCYGCKQHVMRCSCSNGPVQPPWIARWAAEYASSVPTAVGSTKIANKGLSAEGVSVLADNPISESADPPTPDPEHTCSHCHMAVDADTGDESDDGSWLCHVCQEASN